MRLLIAGGGTGGHLFPGLAVANLLRQKDPQADICFVGTARGIEARAVPENNFPLHLLPVFGLRGKGFIGLLKGVCAIPIALVRSLILVRKVRPDVALSLGGYAAGPTILAAWLLRVPCAVMEQNASPGITNKILGRLARRIFAAMPSPYFTPHKMAIVGNPVRAELIAIRETLFIPQKPLRILILGGSQGARFINQLIPNVIKQLGQQNIGITITHQTGRTDLEAVTELYAQADIPIDDSILSSAPVHVIPFITSMDAAYANADLVICRAGATTLAELTVCGRPSILIPYPFATDDHQTKNGSQLVDAGAALLFSETTLTAQKLAQAIAQLATDKPRLKQMAKTSYTLGKPYATQEIVTGLEQMVAKKRGIDV